jgi:hypothetical protein
MPPQDDLTLGEIGRTLERLDKGQKELIDRFDLMRGEFVHKDTYDAQRTASDREIRDVKDRLDKAEARRAPWWSVAAVVVAAAALLTTLIPLINAKP